MTDVFNFRQDFKTLLQEFSAILSQTIFRFFLHIYGVIVRIVNKQTIV